MIPLTLIINSSTKMSFSLDETFNELLKSLRESETQENRKKEIFKKLKIKKLLQFI